MGSTGSGSFTDYPGTTRKKDQGRGAGGGGGGGGDQPDRCAKAFNTTLEDIEHYDYFKTRNTIPPVGTKLSVVHKKRIVAVTEDGLTVGNLPTSLNYLASCLKDGYTYVGTIRKSSKGTVAIVSADFAASAPE